MLFSVFISTDHFIVGKVKLCLWTLWFWKEVTYLQEKVSLLHCACIYPSTSSLLNLWTGATLLSFLSPPPAFFGRSSPRMRFFLLEPTQLYHGTIDPHFMRFPVRRWFFRGTVTPPPVLLFLSPRMCSLTGFFALLHATGVF